MRQLHDGGYNVADNLLAAFAGAGFWPEPGDRILDFGCGEGGLVYGFRDRGFDARGFDIFARPRLRHPDDADFFRMAPGREETPHPDMINIIDSRIDPALYRAPFEDASFDIIVSTSVLEHVIDLPPFLAETKRLLKPGGFAYHIFPNVDVFIEPHVYVPLSSRFQNRAWLHFWAMCGIRNDDQKKMSARETSKQNRRYFKTGLKYRNRKELFEICSCYFPVVRFVDDLYYPGVSRMTFWKNRWRGLMSDDPLKNISKALKMGSLLTQKGPE